MLFKNSQNSKVLLTTPDYPPKLGGLSTLCKSIEKSLQRVGVPFDLFVWENFKTLKNQVGITHDYHMAFHIHFMGAHYLKNRSREHVNFIAGSEILFTSPDPLKKFYKRLFKFRFLKTLRDSHFNLFISEATQELIKTVGFNLDYSRDLVFPCCINVDQAFYHKKSLNDPTLKMICVARDVPHKNISSTLVAANSLAKKTGKPVTLFVTKDLPNQPLVTVKNIAKISDTERDQLLAEAHFNLLFSLDHRSKGFVEGFGLTVLEAGILGTPSIVSCYGGLPEACHHQKTGWVLDPVVVDFDRLFNSLDENEYQRVRKFCFDHSFLDHDDKNYDDLLGSIMKGRDLL